MNALGTKFPSPYMRNELQVFRTGSEEPPPETRVRKIASGTRAVGNCSLLSIGNRGRRRGNMAGLELLSDQGYRVDGRRAGELRKIQARMGVFAQADGSAYIEQGNTKALAVVYGPHEASRHVRAGHRGGWESQGPACKGRGRCGPA